MTLVVAGVVCGLLTAWVFHRTVDIVALGTTFREIHAHFLEFRLFFDEPRLIWHAQKALLRANVRVCGLLLLPTLILALPVAWLMMQLDVVYGTRPLQVGEPAVVTAQMTAGLQDGALAAPPGIAVETPPVHITAERQIVWRIRPHSPLCGHLRFKFGSAQFTKVIAAGDRGMFLVRRRERPLWAFLLHPEESRLPPGDIAWLEVDYPEASRWWIVWFLAISSATAVLFMRHRESSI
jgi:hypothetical protein